VPVKVKICGITRPEDAREAARLGADAIGVNLWPRSKRRVDPAAARAIVEAVPPGVTVFAVFVDPTREALGAAMATSGAAVAQLHGDEPPALCMGHPFPVVKAIRVKDSQALAALASYEVSAFLLDADAVGYGGSGKKFDWTIAAEAAASVPTWLAGGLTPENVAEAVRLVRPLGVDVASGVESAPGVKDHDKLARFIAAAKGALP
jgi:phosphoribosylanthranilate isomerase